MNNTNRTNSFGYIYVATGEFYVKEAVQSAISLRKVTPHADITLITDAPFTNSIFNQVIIKPLEVFHAKQEVNAYYYKVSHIYFSSPYKITCFLDTDTYFLKDCSHLSQLSNYFDICVATAPADSAQMIFENLKIKNLTKFNTGVMVHKKNESNDIFFKKWMEIYKEHADTRYNDQVSFMKAFHDCTSRIYPLPQIYNARIPFFIQLLGKVHIVHGDHQRNNIKNIEKKINIVSRNRVWNPILKRCHFETTLQMKIKSFFSKKIKSPIRG